MNLKNRYERCPICWALASTVTYTRQIGNNSELTLEMYGCNFCSLLFNSKNQWRSFAARCPYEMLLLPRDIIETADGTYMIDDRIYLKRSIAYTAHKAGDGILRNWNEDPVIIHGHEITHFPDTLTNNEKTRKR